MNLFSRTSSTYHIVGAEVIVALDHSTRLAHPLDERRDKHPWPQRSLFRGLLRLIFAPAEGYCYTYINLCREFLSAVYVVCDEAILSVLMSLTA